LKIRKFSIPENNALYVPTVSLSMQQQDKKAAAVQANETTKPG
jgi:hypothetical protein